MAEKKLMGLKQLMKNKYALLIIAVGLILLLLPVEKKQTEREPVKSTATEFSLSVQEQRLAQQLERMEKVGRVSVLLSVEGDGYRQLAESGQETLVLAGDSGEQVVDLHYVNPQYKGAVVVCDGAALPQVRLSISKAVAVFTGLGMDKISVIKMEERQSK